MSTMLKFNDVFFDETAKIIRQLKEEVDKLIKELKELFENVIDTDEYEDTEQKMSKYNSNKSKYTRENDYYKNQFKLAKRHVCIENKCKY